MLSLFASAACCWLSPSPVLGALTLPLLTSLLRMYSGRGLENLGNDIDAAGLASVLC